MRRAAGTTSCIPTDASSPGKPERTLTMPAWSTTP
nr:MAG TPA: hypothetical protein [Caudoviricetes sp.]